MKILFISHVNNGITTGAGIYSQSIIDLLKEVYTDAEIITVYAVQNNTFLFRSIRKIVSILKLIFSTKSSKVYYFMTPGLKKSLKINGHLHWDCIIIDHAELLWVHDYMSCKCQFIHISHNVEHQIYKEYLTKKKYTLLIKYLLRVDVERYKKFELAKIKNIHNLISISTDDACYFKNEIPEVNVVAIPPSFKYTKYNYNKKINGTIKIGFLANMRWWPNREGLFWFMRDVLPFVNNIAEFHIFGRESEKCKRNDLNVVVHGFVQDKQSIWEKSDLMINPIFDGGGVCIKVVEAIYNSMPLLCTTKAMKGIQLPKYHHSYISISDSPSEWVAIIRSIVSGEILLSAQPNENIVNYKCLNQKKKIQQMMQPIC